MIETHPPPSTLRFPAQTPQNACLHLDLHQCSPPRRSPRPAVVLSPSVSHHSAPVESFMSPRTCVSRTARVARASRAQWFVLSPPGVHWLPAAGFLSANILRLWLPHRNVPDGARTQAHWPKLHLPNLQELLQHLPPCKWNSVLSQSIDCTVYIASLLRTQYYGFGLWFWGGWINGFDGLKGGGSIWLSLNVTINWSWNFTDQRVKNAANPQWRLKNCTCT